MKKRSETNDEFFVIKKNPLILPPDYDKLPKPLDEETEIYEKDDDIKKLLTNKSKKSINTSSKDSSLENSILEKINE